MKNICIIIKITLILIALGGKMAAAQTEFGSHIAHRDFKIVSMVAIISNPKVHLGKAVGVYGVFIQQGLESYIYMDRFSVECNNISEAIPVIFESNSFDEPLDDQLGALHNKVVYMEAVFERGNGIGMEHVFRVNKVKIISPES